MLLEGKQRIRIPVCQGFTQDDADVDGKIHITVQAQGAQRLAYGRVVDLFNRDLLNDLILTVYPKNESIAPITIVVPKGQPYFDDFPEFQEIMITGSTAYTGNFKSGDFD